MMRRSSRWMVVTIGNNGAIAGWDADGVGFSFGSVAEGTRTYQEADAWGKFISLPGTFDLQFDWLNASVITKKQYVAVGVEDDSGVMRVYALEDADSGTGGTGLTTWGSSSGGLDPVWSVGDVGNNRRIGMW